jgi:hypothetical protein
MLFSTIVSGKEQPNKLIGEKQLLEDLQFSARHLWNLRKRRMIPYTKVGRRVMYNPTDVERALNKLSVKEIG